MAHCAMSYNPTLSQQIPAPSRHFHHFAQGDLNFRPHGTYTLEVRRKPAFRITKKNIEGNLDGLTPL